MKVSINGTDYDLEDSASIADVLAILGYGSSHGLAVAVDKEVIPKQHWDDLRLAEGMKIEVLRAVQGG